MLDIGIKTYRRNHYGYDSCFGCHFSFFFFGLLKSHINGSANICIPSKYSQSVIKISYFL